MVHAEDVVSIYQSLLENGIQVWLTGGWGIDALLGEQTRPHKDLDVIMLLDDVARARELLGRDGYRLKMLWSENRWDVDAHGVETATAFVLQDSEGREFDAHAMRLDDQGNGIPAWAEAEEFLFTRQDLAGEGTIAGVAVQCLTPEMQMLCHTGYALPDEHLRDLERLHQMYGVDYPKQLDKGSSLEGAQASGESQAPQAIDAQGVCAAGHGRGQARSDPRRHNVRLGRYSAGGQR